MSHLCRAFNRIWFLLCVCVCVHIYICVCSMWRKNSLSILCFYFMFKITFIGKKYTQFLSIIYHAQKWEIPECKRKVHSTGTWHGSWKSVVVTAAWTTSPGPANTKQFRYHLWHWQTAHLDTQTKVLSAESFVNRQHSTESSRLPEIKAALTQKA